MQRRRCDNKVNPETYEALMLNKKKIRELYKRFSTSGIAKRMAQGSFWSVLGTAISKGLFILAGIVCARIMGKTQYGEFGMVRSIINTVVAIGGTGIGVTAAKFISELRETNKERVASIYMLTNGFAFIVGFIAAILVFFGARYLSVDMLNTESLLHPIQIAAIILLFVLFNWAQNGTLNGFEDFKSIAINNMIGSTVEAVCMIIGAIFWGVAGAVIGLGMGYLVITICNNQAIKRNLKRFKVDVKFSRFDKKESRLLYQFAVPATIASVLTAPVFWAIRAMLVNVSDYAELATYEVADQWRLITLFFPSALSQIVLPILSSIGDKGSSTYKNSLNAMLAVNFTITIIVAIIVSMFSKYIMSFYGSAYTNVIPIIFVCFSSAFVSISNVIGLAITAQGKVWLALFFNLITASMTIGFTYISLQNGYGVNGMSFSIFASYLLSAIIMLIYIKMSKTPIIAKNK